MPYAVNPKSSFVKLLQKIVFINLTPLPWNKFFKFFVHPCNYF